MTVTAWLKRIDPGTHRRIKGLRLVTAYGIAWMMGDLQGLSWQIPGQASLGVVAAGMALWASVSEGRSRPTTGRLGTGGTGAPPCNWGIPCRLPETLRHPRRRPRLSILYRATPRVRCGSRRKGSYANCSCGAYRGGRGRRPAITDWSGRASFPPCVQPRNRRSLPRTGVADGLASGCCCARHRCLEWVVWSREVRLGNYCVHVRDRRHCLWYNGQGFAPGPRNGDWRSARSRLSANCLAVTHAHLDYGGTSHGRLCHGPA